MRPRLRALLHLTGQVGEEVIDVTLMVLVFVVLIGPLAALYGVDSRLDDRRDGWPATRR
jgi:hypothetical protein